LRSRLVLGIGFGALGDPGSREALAVAALLDEVTFQSTDLLIEQVRAACTIWSWVRERLSMNRSQKETVAS
jgi:hypothetical protein